MSQADPPRLGVVIADDEPLARRLLRGMLEERDGIDVVAEAGDGEEAVRVIRETRPDLVFLDVRMPGLTGPEIVRALGGTAPLIVFVTAYDGYAVEAFELRALDYLLKPFDEIRLEETLLRARERRRQGASVSPLELAAMIDAARTTRGGPERIFLAAGDRTIIRRLEDIDWIEADRKVLNVHAGGRVYTTPGPLAAMEDHLDPRTFVRVSRSTIVNLDRVAEVQTWFGGEMVLIMTDRAQVTTSRGYRSRLDAVLGRVPRRERK